MDINVKNTYDLFFHPFEGQGPTKRGLGRLAASVAIFIGTIGIYHLVVGSIQKWRVTHPGDGGNVSGVFHNVHGTQAASRAAKAFFKKHPQMIRPSMWKEWAEEAGVQIQTVTDEEAYAALPADIEAMLNKPCNNRKKVEANRIHVYIPPGLSVEDLGKILKTRFPQTGAGYRCLKWSFVLEALRDQTTVGGWYEMTKDLISQSRSNPKHQEMIQELCNEDEQYEVPTALVSIACCLAWYFNTGKSLFSGDYTGCQEQVHGHQVFVGGFTREGLDVCNFLTNNTLRGRAGVAAMRKLS